MEWKCGWCRHSGDYKGKIGVGVARAKHLRKAHQWLFADKTISAIALSYWPSLEAKGGSK